jgi:hypothetical protein
MGTRARSLTPDLFSTPTREAHSQPSEPIGPQSTVSRHILPADLPNAIRHLKEEELDRLLSVVIAEQRRRGKLTAVSSKRVEVAAAVPLTQGKLNAIRASFKAGVTPSRIARQFGISQSDIRKALASDVAKP